MTSSPDNSLPHSDAVLCHGDDALPHPQVFLALNAQGFVVCPYCSKRFEAAGQHDALQDCPPRFSTTAGIAIGPILFVIAILALLAAVMASGGSEFQVASSADRITSDIVSQTNLIRSTITQCNLQYQMALSIGSVSSQPDSYPTAASATLVSALLCDPLGTSSIWSNSTSAIMLPQPTQGFNAWQYINAGASGGGRCFWTSPSGANPLSSSGIVSGLTRAASKFNSATTNSKTSEVLYDPTSSTQKFVVWITPPSGTANSNCTIP